MLNCYKGYKRCIHISYHILDYIQQRKIKFMMEQPYMLPILYCQCHACWCPGDLRSQGNSRHGVDQISQNIPSLTSEELMQKKCNFIAKHWSYISFAISNCKATLFTDAYMHDTRDHFVHAPSQWEATLQCNIVSHWLSACTKWSLDTKPQWTNWSQGRWQLRADSRSAPSQWETLLQSNAVSHWLCANLESALQLF